MYDIRSKTIDGITDLVVVAPIREGFIAAYENITYATRLKLVAEALNRVRVSAREHERVTPYSDVTERILTLLDFRVGLIDEDLFALTGTRSAYGDATTDPGFSGGGSAATGGGLTLKSRRYLYLTATFDGAWEPYMRLIWQPLGTFLDILFCNCEGYVTATDHSFAEYAQWVRDNQMDSSIFYATTGLTVRDHLYLSKIERLQRAGASDRALAETVMDWPEDRSAQTRKDMLPKAIQLGLEALTVLYKLADFYPPQWMTGDAGDLAAMDEGHRLVRVARDLLLGWDPMIASFEKYAMSLPVDHPTRLRWTTVRRVYAEPLKWYATGVRELVRRDAAMKAAEIPDPAFDRSEVQGGILKAAGSRAAPVQHGALLLFTVRSAKATRAFLKSQNFHFAAGPGADGDDGLFKTIAFTWNGLSRMGVAHDVIERFPTEFRDGMAMRSGQFGDMRENHPRNWMLPERNGPGFMGRVPAETKLPPVVLDEVDFVIQLRSTNPDHGVIEAAVRMIADAAADGATLESIEWLEGNYDPDTGRFVDHFGFTDGMSQPKAKAPDGIDAPAAGDRDAVKLGEILLGYANDHDDSAPTPFSNEANWRAQCRSLARELQFNGSYLVLRKIGEEVDAFDKWLTEQSAAINDQHALLSPMTPARLKALVLGRNADGTPLIAPETPGNLNDFDYGRDGRGHACPFAAHVRRANPRRIDRDVAAAEMTAAGEASDRAATYAEFGRNTPRLLRRGLRFTQGPADAPRRGLMFMAYNASIAEQYEVVQRWLNGGNSTYVASAHADPLTGVQPKEDAGVFRFIVQGKKEPVVVHAPLPRIAGALPGVPPSEPGRHPFTPLYWGLYLFAPSRRAITMLATLPELAQQDPKYQKLMTRSGEYEPLREPLEQVNGEATMARLRALDPAQSAEEWKRLIEDVDAKDPALRDVTSDVWSAIRYYCGGAHNLRRGVDDPGPIKNNPDEILPPPDWSQPPDRDRQNVVLCAGYNQLFQVLSAWDKFSTEEQLRRIAPNSGPIFVTQQPDNRYNNPDLADKGYNYPAEARATNEILLGYDEEAGFQAGYAAGKAVLDQAKAAATLAAQTTAADETSAARAAAEAAIARGVPPAVANAQAQAVAEAAAAKASHPFFKMELRRQYLLPALGGLCKQWYGLPDDKHMLAKGWGWEKIVEVGTDPLADTPDGVTRTKAHCPGDFLSPSRNAFYPRPGPQVASFANSQGQAILRAAEAFVAEHRAAGGPPTDVGDNAYSAASVARAMFAAIDDDAVLARNLIGTMVGAIPPMDGNLRGILVEWLGENTLWRHQAALRSALGGAPAISNFAAARAALYKPVSQAMCKRPAPDLLYRTALGKSTISVSENARNDRGAEDISTEERDLIVVSLVSASQRSLLSGRNDGAGEVSIVFGGRRDAPDQGYVMNDGVTVPDPNGKADHPVHACPAQDMAMGAIMGIMAALLDAGTIQAQPASMIVRINDWG